MRIRDLLNKKAILLKSGSSHSFIDFSVGEGMKNNVIYDRLLTMVVANGQKAINGGECSEVQWRMQSRLLLEFQNYLVKRT